MNASAPHKMRAAAYPSRADPVPENATIVVFTFFSAGSFFSVGSFFSAGTFFSAVSLVSVRLP